MPRFSKELLSQYLRTGCQRQLRLGLYPEIAAFQAERDAQGLPPEHKDRRSLTQIGQAGNRWQDAKVRDLEAAFGQASLVGRRDPQTQAYKKAELSDALAHARPGVFLVECEFDVTGSFRRAVGTAGVVDLTGNPLVFARVRPDVVEVLAPGTAETWIDPAGTLVPADPADPRVVLRVLDIKLAEEPSAHYFAEVVYYSMVLAGWLRAQALQDHFVVAGDPAVWPGSHQASNLALRRNELLQQGIIPTPDQLHEFMRADLRTAEVEAFAPRIRRVLVEEVPAVLQVADWRDLRWHVDSRCIGCDFLGYAWPGGTPPDDDHCWPMAERIDHLSRVPFVTRGASDVLRDGQVATVTELSIRDPADDVFHEHHGLRASRAILPLRAQSLRTGITGIAEHTGRPAGMPNYVDLHIYLSVDFDVTSAITFAFGIEGFWRERVPFGSPVVPATRAWADEAFIVESCSVAVEEREFLRLLHRIQDMLVHAAQHERPDLTTRLQVYLWDSLQFDHFTRVLGRHLPAIIGDPRVWQLAWLFPSDELVADPQAVTRVAPITLVSEVVRTHLAASIPHHYGLLEVAQAFNRNYVPHDVNAFYRDPLSDQIPSERAQEVWTRAPEWRARLHGTELVVKEKLRALRGVTQRLEYDLRGILSQRGAATLRIGPPGYVSRLSLDGQLWFAFARLNSALEQYRVHQIRAMPPHEREARFHSARLTRRLTGAEEVQALGRLGLAPAANCRVYEIDAHSVEVKLKEGDFNVALAPRNAPDLLDLFHQQVFEGTPAELRGGAGWRTRMEDVAQVTVRRIARDARLLVLDHSPRNGLTLDQVEQDGWYTTAQGNRRRVDLSREVMLDPKHADFFTKKLRAALEAVGNPPAAGQNPLVARAVGQVRGPRASRTTHTPPADFLWNASAMHASAVARDLVAARQYLEGNGVRLNDSQWAAWNEALSRRLQLVWGPPGTGKSRTMRAIVMGAATAAHLSGRPIRILVCAGTYAAMDKVLEVLGELPQRLPGVTYEAYRVRSSYSLPNPAIPATEVVLRGRAATPDIVALRMRLQNADGITIVGAPPEQVHNLMVAGGTPAQQELFDLILIDEASQTDVAHAILPICAIADGGSIVLSGDHLQLDPIHQARPPAGLESMVGAVFNFYRDLHAIPLATLTTNYRSNVEIVRFSRRAGYGAQLTSHSPGLRLDLHGPLPMTAAAPPGWPASLYWTPEWSALLDPDSPTVAFVYPDGRSSQWNPFEVDAVVALLVLLHGRLGNRLRGERDAEGRRLPPTAGVYDPAEFWTAGVGVVTPHRAQQGRIIGRLQQIFGPTGVDPALIRDAVDTVERFQGQERDVIIASFALGDADVVRSEEEFLMQLNRFNVMASRPRAKLIMLVSQEVVDHLSNDAEVIRNSRLLKVYAESHCAQARPMDLGFLDEGGVFRARSGLFRRP